MIGRAIRRHHTIWLGRRVRSAATATHLALDERDHMLNVGASALDVVVAAAAGWHRTFVRLATDTT